MQKNVKVRKIFIKREKKRERCEGEMVQAKVKMNLRFNGSERNWKRIKRKYMNSTK